MDQQQWYPPNEYEEERRPRRHDDDYRRDRDRRHSRHRRKRSRSRSRSRERYGSDRRRSRRYSRSRSRSRSRSNSRSRSRHRNRSRDLSPQRRRSFEYGSRGEGPQRHYDYGMDDQEYRDFQGHMRDERHLDQEPESSGGGPGGGGRRNEKDWRMKLTSIRDAHFNRSKQPPPFAAQNQFQNDGSFLEMFKKKMAADNETDSSLTPNSLVLASSSIPYSSDISLPPLTAVADPKPQASTSSSADQDLDGVPLKKTTLPVPVSIGRRRCAKPLKTGVVFKKQQQTDEDEGSQEKLDAWARYLQEVQKYKKDNLVEEDGSRPLVK